MRKRVFSIPFTGQLNTRIDPRLATVPLVHRADNVYRARTGEWAPRNGYTALPAAYHQTANTIDVVRKLAARGSELVVVDTRRFWSWSAELQKFVDLSGFQGGFDQTIATHEIFRPDDAYTQAAGQPNAQEVDVAFGANCLFTAWSQAGAAANFVVFSVSEVGTGQKRKAPTLASSGAGGSCRDVRCVFAGGWFMVFFVDEGAGNSTLRAFGFEPVTGSTRGPTTIASADLMGTGTGTPFYDVYVRPDNGKVVIAYRSAASTLKALEWDGLTNAASIAAVTVVASDVGSAAIGWIDTGTSGTTNPRLATAVNGATGVVRRILSGTTLGQNSAQTVQATPGDVSFITGVYDGTDDTLFWQVEHATDVELARVKFATANGPTVNDFLMVGALASKARFVQPTGGAAAIPYVAVRQPWKNLGTLFVCAGKAFDTTRAQMPIARILRGKTPHAFTRRGHLSSVPKVSSTRLAIASREIYDASVTGALGITTTLFDRPVVALVEWSGRVPEPVQFSSQVFFPGSMPRAYGGQRVGEVGHQVDPTAFASVIAAGAGGSLSAGSYQYTHKFVHQDNEGRLWRSGPGAVSKVTAIASDLVNLSIKQPFVISRTFSSGGGITWVELYRTKANGTVFYRVPLGNTVLDPTTQTLALADGVADTDLEQNFQIAEGGGELFNSPPPPCLGAVVQGDRIVVIDAERPTRIMPCKEMQPGQGTGWHDDLAVVIEADGPCTALALIEGRVIAFKRQSVWMVTGDWPDANGTGPLPTVQQIAVGYGTIEPESVCIATDGVWFKDPKKGICFIDRGLQVHQSGKPVQKDDTNDVVAAHVVEDFTQVRFVTATGRSPVYDYFEKQWSTFFGTTGIPVNRTAAAVVGGVHYVAAGAVVYFYDPASFVDAAATYFCDLVMRLSFAGIEGVQRLYRLTVLGELQTAGQTLAARFTNDYGNSAEFDQRSVSDGVPLSDQGDAYATLPGTFALTLRPREGRMTNTILQVFWPLNVTGAGNVGGVRLSGLAAEVGFPDKPGVRRLSPKAVR